MTIILSLFLVGLLGVGHCAGMCGPIALGITPPTNKQTTVAAWKYFFILHVSRIATYTFIGLIGALLTEGLERIQFVQSYLYLLRYVAAGLLVFIACYVLGVWSIIPWIEKLGEPIWRRIKPVFAKVYPPKSTGALIASGFLWGFLPCGLVYSALIVAITSTELFHVKVLSMVAFGLGTTTVFIALQAFTRLTNKWRNTAAWKYTTFILLISSSVGLVVTMNQHSHTMTNKNDNPSQHHHHH